MALPLLTISLITLEAKAQTISREDLKATLVHVQVLAKEAVKDADASRVELAKSKSLLEQTRAKLADATSSVAVLKVDVDKLTAWGVEQQRDATAAKLALTAEKKAHAETQADYHRLKLYAAILAAGLAVLLALRLWPLFAFLGPWAAAIPIVAAGAMFAAVWCIF